MNKTKLLTFAVIALLILNFGILTFLFLRNPHHQEGKEMPRKIIIEKLHFDKNQITDYDKLFQKHREHIRENEDNIRNSKNELYLLLNQEPINISKKDSLISNLAQLQKEIETAHFNHFQDIKKLCKKDQLADFESLTNVLSRIFSKQRRTKNEQI